MNPATPARAEPAHFSPVTLLHTLHLYGAAAVASFGWAVCRLLDWDATPWVPLWFCGALFIYNADRLRRDPADAVNVPERVAAMQHCRGWSVVIVTLSAAVLVVLPIAAGDWVTLALVLGGAVVCLNYFIPWLGFRFKDLPVAKTFFAPTVVAVAIFALPWLHAAARVDRTLLIAVAVLSWGLLLFNMILCDLRDVEGDRRAGTLSLPAVLGLPRTRWLLALLLVAVESLAFLVVAHCPASHALAWRLLCVLGPLYLGGLIAAVRVRRSERFYECWVEGMFLLPAAAVLGEWAVGLGG